MKKYLSVFLLVCIFIVGNGLWASANMTGDLDNDGMVTAADARLALRAAVGLEPLADGAADAADVDCDDVITASDARLILRYSVGLERFPGGLTVTFLDVGQADSIFVESGGDTLLVDGGNVADAPVVTAFLRAQGVTSLDYVVCTHAHEDHVGGLTGVLEAFPAEAVFAPRTQATTVCYTKFRNVCTQNGYLVRTPALSETFSVGPTTVQVLGPVSEDVKKINDTSIVLKLTYGKTSVLLTGDAEHVSEEALLAAGSDLSATVLKLGHHGSNTSTGDAFLAAVAPELAVVSVGAGNSYGHPSDAVLARVQAAGIRLFRTDLHGTIEVVCNGKTISCQPVADSR